MDILDSLPKALGRVKFVIVAIDYFTKWVEAKSLAKITVVARPQANGLVERASKSVMEGLKTRLSKDGSGGWTDYLMCCGLIEPPLKQATTRLYSDSMPTHRYMRVRESNNEEELCLNFDLLQERMEATTIWEATHKTQMEQRYNKKV
ncbi:reverse transcriptase domain-containing protein [Tanacetum coccineum]|uniref:Reverse transcriptase domain-containing protein n=1 Tax=Tanacetum coccineum TaxID=301880 RepID=A0ABQ4YWB1_9ASTR